jgi:II/X family phage/plasmid replication protein
MTCGHDPEKLQSGRVLCLDPAGELSWYVDKALSVEGSYSSKIQIKSHTSNSIWISGNPTKFLQGHNIFGSDDLIYIMGRFFDSLLSYDIGLKPSSDEYDRIQEGYYSLKRVDINHSWHLKDRDAVLSWIRAAGNCARLKHRGSGQYSGDTLYFAKHSRRWSVKCYSKGHEINAKGHQLPKELQHPELIEWAEKSLRIEMVIRGMQLKEMLLNNGKNWTPETAKMLLCSYVLDNLEVSDNMALQPSNLEILKPRLRMVYQTWLAGDDLRKVLPKNTFYRYRRELLPYGIDIAIVQQSERKNIIPLIHYLEAEPAEIPNWAYEKGLVA